MRGDFFRKSECTRYWGFFVAGIMVGRGKRPALRKTRPGYFLKWFMPYLSRFFFVGIGLKVDFFKEFDFFLGFICNRLSVFLVSFLGAWIGVKFTKLSPRE